MTLPKETSEASLCLALSHELRVAREMLEALAGVLVADARFVEDHLDQLQAFDRISQYMEESAGVLQRVAEGETAGQAVQKVRLEEMQRRLMPAVV